jgi:aconitate hydratase
VAGDNYGQGSSREHAALAPLQLGVRAVFAKAFHRIHRRNLINNGIVPVLIDDAIHGKAAIGQDWALPQVHREIAEASPVITIRMDGEEYPGRAVFTDHERQILLSGGLLRYLKSNRDASKR